MVAIIGIISMFFAPTFAKVGKRPSGCESRNRRVRKSAGFRSKPSCEPPRRGTPRRVLQGRRIMAGRATTPTVDADAAADAQAASPAAAAAASSKSLKPAKYFQWNEELDIWLASMVRKPSSARALVANLIWATLCSETYCDAEAILHNSTPTQPKATTRLKTLTRATSTSTRRSPMVGKRSATRSRSSPCYFSRALS
jgi:hypothetical protein